MRPATGDRLIVIALAGSLMLWAGCLLFLWSAVLDGSGSTTLTGLSGLLLAAVLAGSLPVWTARALQRLAHRSASPAAATQGASRATDRLLAFAAALAAVCAALSTALLLPTGRAYAAISVRFLLPFPLRLSLKLLLQTAAMMPIGLAFSLLFLGGAVLRSGLGRDACAAAGRDWLWGGACGLAVLAAGWQLGANLLGLCAVSCAVMLGASGVLLFRRTGPPHPTPRPRPVERRWRRHRAGAVLTFAALAILLLVQGRALRDILAAGQAFRFAWVALSLALLAGFLERADRRSRRPRRSASAGSVIGATAAALAQSVVAVCGHDADQLACGVLSVLAAAAQVPLLASLAIVISRQRRMFVAAGGRARGYLSVAAGGMAIGVLACLACGMIGEPGLILGAAIVLLAGAVVVGIAQCRRPADQLRWAVCGAAVMASLCGMVGVGLVHVERRSGPLRAGVWLTLASGRPAGFLPEQRVRRSDAVDAAISEIVASRPGRWWLAAGSEADLPATMPVRSGLRTVPDPSLRIEAGPHAVRLIHGVGDYFDPSGPRQTLFDGVLLAPIPADHPEAWRCYNTTALRQVEARRVPDIPVLLRTQSHWPGVRSLAVVAKAYREAFGPGWMLAASSDEGVDVLMVSPADAVVPAGWLPGVSRVRLDEFCRDWDDVEAMRPESPGGAWARREDDALRFRRSLGLEGY